MREDEDLGCSDRVEPLLDPAPHSREERGCANDLGSLISMHHSSMLASDSRIFDPMSPGNEQ